MKFSGVIPPLCTPLDEAGDVDSASLARLVEHLVRSGVSGIFALGSTGEAIYLTDSQRRRVVDVVTVTVSRQVPVFVGAVAGTTARVINQIQLLTRSGVDALVVTAPFYADVTEQEAERHFTEVAAAATLPILAYDIPGNVGRKLWPSLTTRLLREGVVIGIKDSSGDWDDFVKLCGLAGSLGDVSVLTGADTRAADALSTGADGIVPGIANVIPELAVALYQAHASGDRARMAALQEKITEAAAMFHIGTRYGLGLHASQMGMLKSVLVEQGIIRTAAVATPLTPYPDAARQEALTTLRTLTTTA